MITEQKVLTQSVCGPDFRGRNKKSRQESATEEKKLLIRKEKALQRVVSGLDFYVRNQQQDSTSANFGRFPYVYNCMEHKIVTFTGNWTTGVIAEAMLAGYKLTGEQKYLVAAENACSYLKSLQCFLPGAPRLYGIFREFTPQSNYAYPRDALTAALALLDYSVVTGDKGAEKRAVIYGEWFISVAMEKGYPYWAVRFEEPLWEPSWCGSFHSGSAFFMSRLFAVTGNHRYKDAMCRILDFYNQNHLDENGNITVILDRDTLEPLDGKADSRFSNPGWEMMHRYNDDFGALANLAAWKATGKQSYWDGATRFLDNMIAIQDENGGFGPPKGAIPSAAGAVAIELQAAVRLGIKPVEYGNAAGRAFKYLEKLQYSIPGDEANGAFFGMDEKYAVSSTCSNARSGGYAMLAMIRYAGSADDIYFFGN